jgi:hypothetical protein
VRQDLQGKITWTDVNGKKVSVILKTSKPTVFDLTFLELSSTYPDESTDGWSDTIQVCIVHAYNSCSRC